MMILWFGVPLVLVLIAGGILLWMMATDDNGLTSVGLTCLVVATMWLAAGVLIGLVMR